MPNVLNQEAHFAQAPAAVDIQRSKFPRDFSWKGSCKAGYLNCFLCDDALPGDTVSGKVSDVFRMMTPYYPVMDDCFIDKYLFAVPLRLVWTHAAEFFGENNSSAWVENQEYTIPQTTLPTAGRTVGDFAHEIGIPMSFPSTATVSALYFRAYALIWNEWFRNQNIQDPLAIDFGDTQNPYWGTASFPINALLPVTRVKDVFGTALPNTQKGDAVKIALSGWTNVTTSSSAALSGTGTSLTWNSIAGNAVTGSTPTVIGVMSGLTTSKTTDANLTTLTNIYPSNLIVDLEAANSDGDYVGVDVETLRLAVATQRILEQLAVGGSRYVEFVRSMFGVVSPDARQQRPELLAYSRTHVRMNEVTQTSPQLEQTAGDTTPLGTIGAYSKTVDSNLTFNHSFTEHTILLGLFCIRHNRTYSQGIDPMFTRKSMFDFYMPQLAHIGEQPIYTKELYCDSSTVANNTIFGYQEAWYNYRTKKSIATGLLDPSVSGTLGDVWTYTDLYNSAPTLSKDWIEEGHTEIDRTLAVTDSDEFIVDIWCDYKWTRPMPVYSVPGLTGTF